jgi:hypothetical protein
MRSNSPEPTGVANAMVPDGGWLMADQLLFQPADMGHVSRCALNFPTERWPVPSGLLLPVTSQWQNI